MKRCAALFVVILCLAPRAHADQASKRAKIEELFSLLRMDKLLQQVMDASETQATQMTSQMFGGTIPPEVRPKLDQLQQRMKAVIEGQLAWKKLEPDYVTLYSNNFTEEQIDNIVAFYKTPTGRAFVEKQPVLTQQGMQLAQGRITSVQPQLRALLEDFVKQVRAMQPAAKPQQHP
jgi:uncharacterized protein